MVRQTESPIETLVERVDAGDGAPSTDEWVHALYAPLREIAHRRLRQERRGHTLTTTALVHEAYLELVGRGAAWRGRAHFLAAASRIMRNLLVDHARRRNAQKRGGDLDRVQLDEDELVSDAAETQAAAIEALHEALERLVMVSPRQSALLEQRYFGGLSLAECAEALGVSKATVSRELRLARAWLACELMPAGEA